MEPVLDMSIGSVYIYPNCNKVHEENL